MSFRCSDVLQVFQNSKIHVEVLGGAKNLDRVVRWVYVAEAMDSILSTINWISGYELIIITGSKINGDPTPVLVEFIKRCATKQVAGLVINTGNYISSVPTEAIRTADALGLPLMVVPWETRLVEFTKIIGTAIFERELKTESENVLADNLLFGQSILNDSTQFLLAKYGFSNAFGYTVAVMELNNSASTFPQHQDDLRFRLADHIRMVFTHQKQQVVVTCLVDCIVAIVKLSKNNTDYKKNFEIVGKNFRRQYPFCKPKVAVGKICYSLTDIPESFRSAQQLLRIYHFSDTNVIAYFEDIGVYSLLFAVSNLEVLRNYYLDLFTPLIENDKSSGTSLLYTLAVYIEHNASLVNAAKALFIHENTLKYRLSKVRSLMHIDTNSLEDLTRINIGFKVGRLFGFNNFSTSPTEYCCCDK